MEIGQYEKTLARFKSDVFPWLGKRPIIEIDAPEILAVLKRIDGRGARLLRIGYGARSAGSFGTA